MLKTKLEAGELHYTPKTLYADAMYAHALVMAMDEVTGDRFDTIPKIKNRAAELMRSWGYTED